MNIEGKSLEENKSFLERCAATTLSSKLVGSEKDFLVKMVVDPITTLDENNYLNMIEIKKVILAMSSSMFAQNMFRSLQLLDAFLMRTPMLKMIVLVVCFWFKAKEVLCEIPFWLKGWHSRKLFPMQALNNSLRSLKTLKL